ncbi:hypothetical protein AO391_16940 [Pseudomonas marginalis ICMP 9505]|nr:hypothetical protein AO391_16940 [Pseudomonas marginalis ICMP 9505]PHN31738.1 hypothetical protein AO240_15740 [Pseudomonas sp. ICMP 460]
MRTPAASKGLAYFFKALRRIEHPRTRLPWRLVTQVLSVPAGQFDNPVQRKVLVESSDQGCR